MDAAVLKLVEVAPYGGFVILLGFVFYCFFSKFVKTMEKSFATSVDHIRQAYDKSNEKNIELIKLLQERVA